MAKHSRGYNPGPMEPAYQPGPCPACGCERSRELGQYLNGPCLTVIRCPACGHQVSAAADSIQDSQRQARAKWDNPGLDDAPPWDENTAAGLMEDEL